MIVAIPVHLTRVVPNGDNELHNQPEDGFVQIALEKIPATRAKKQGQVLCLTIFSDGGRFDLKFNALAAANLLGRMLPVVQAIQPPSPKGQAPDVIALTDQSGEQHPA
jgi:hypothetical protein